MIILIKVNCIDSSLSMLTSVNFNLLVLFHHHHRLYSIPYYQRLLHSTQGGIKGGGINPILPTVTSFHTRRNQRRRNQSHITNGYFIPHIVPHKDRQEESKEEESLFYSYNIITQELFNVNNL